MNVVFDRSRKENIRPLHHLIGPHTIIGIFFFKAPISAKSIIMRDRSVVASSLLFLALFSRSGIALAPPKTAQQHQHQSEPPQQHHAGFLAAEEKCDCAAFLAEQQHRKHVAETTSGTEGLLEASDAFAADFERVKEEHHTSFLGLNWVPKKPCACNCQCNPGLLPPPPAPPPPVVTLPPPPAAMTPPPAPYLVYPPPPLPNLPPPAPLVPSLPGIGTFMGAKPIPTLGPPPEPGPPDLSPPKPPPAPPEHGNAGLPPPPPEYYGPSTHIYSYH